MPWKPVVKGSCPGVPARVPRNATAARPLSPATADSKVAAVNGAVPTGNLSARSTCGAQVLPWSSDQVTTGWKSPPRDQDSYTRLLASVATLGSKPSEGVGAPGMV